MNETRDHPSISGKVMGFIFLFAFLAVIAFGLFLYLKSEGYEHLSGWFLMGFFVLVPIGLAGGFVMLYHVKCPACGGETKTIQNKKLDMWQAHCPKCQITWNLGLGIDTGP